MTLDDLQLLYDLIDPDLTTRHTISRDEAAVMIEPLLQQFICKEAGRRTLQQAAMDVALLRLNYQDFEDFYVKALDMLLGKRPVTDFVIP